MNIDNGATSFALSLDNAKLEAAIRQARRQLHSIGDSAVAEGERVDSAMDKIAAAVGAAFTLNAAKDFAMQVVNVRAQIQALEVSFSTLLGSKQQADRMLAEMKDFATTSPLGLEDLAKAGQTLLGFGIEAQRIMPLMQQIGDVAMGDASKFQSLTLAFAQMSASGRLMGQDLLQMINAGFNPLQTMSEQTGKSLGVLKKEMEKGAISSQMVADAFRAATSEGGKFHGMLAAQGQTIAGKMGQLQDAISTLLNEIGTNHQDTIARSLDNLIALTEHWQEVAKVVGVLITTFGAYKAAMMAVWAVQKGMAAMSTIATFLSLARSIHSAKDAMIAFNLVTKASPLGLLIGAISAAVAAYALYRNEIEEVLGLTTAVSRAQEEMQQSLGKELARVDRLFTAMQNAKKGTQAYKQAKAEIISQYGGYLKGLSKEVAQLDNVRKAYDAIRRAATDAAKARAMEKLSTQAADKLIETQGEARADVAKLLRKRYGDQVVKHSSGQIESMVDFQLRQYDKIIAGKVTQKQAQLWANRQMSGSAKSGFEWLVQGGNVIPNAIRNAIEAQREYNDTIKQGEEAFGKLQIKAKETLQEAAATSSPAKADKNGDKAAQRIAKEQAQRSAAIAAYYSQLEEQQAAAELDLRARQIELMEEGADKTQAQISLNYDRLLHENRQRASAMLEELAKMRHIEWEKHNPKATDAQSLEAQTHIRQSLTNSDLSKAQLAQLQAYTELADKYRKSAEQKMLTELLDKYKSYADRKVEIERKASEELTALQVAQREGKITTSQFISRSESIKSARDAANAAIDKEAQNAAKDEATLLVALYEDAGRKSRAQIADILDRTQQLLDYIKGEEDVELPVGISLHQIEELRRSPEKLKAVTDAFIRLREQAEAGQHPFERLAHSIGQLFRSRGKEDKSRAIAKLSAIATEAAHAAGDLLTQLSQVFEQGGDKATAETLQSTGKAINDIVGVASKFASGDVVGGVVATLSTAINLVGIAAKAEADHQRALQTLREQALAQQQAYNDALFDTALALDKMGAMGEDAFGRMINSAKLAAQKHGELQSLMNGLGNVYVKNGSHKEGILWWRKQVDEYGSLLDRYPKLINAAGNLDVELAKSLLSTAAFKDDAAKAKLQRIIDTAEQATKAGEGVNQYIESVFGNTAQSLSDALVSAFRNGTNAAHDFSTSLEGMLEKMAQDVATSLYITPLIEKAQKEASALLSRTDLSPEEQMRKMAAVMGSTMKQAVSIKEQVEMVLQAADIQAQANGLDLWRGGKDSSSSGSRGFTAMSQQSADELNGRFAALQISAATTTTHTSGILQSVQQSTAQLAALSMQLATTNHLLGEIQRIEALSHATLTTMSELQGIAHRTQATHLAAIDRTLSERL